MYQKLEIRNQFNHPHIIKFLGINHPQIMQLLALTNCQRNFLFFEYQYYSLEKMIEARQVYQLFQEKDLICLLNGMISALSFLQYNGISHGNIQTSTIFFDQVKGKFLINDQELLTGKYKAFFDCKYGNIQRYLAPEELVVLMDNSRNIEEIDSYKADVFSLGMVLLEASTLQSSADIYNFEQGNYYLKQDVLNDRLLYMYKYYSPSFVHVIRLMIDFESDIRPNFIDLQYLLQKSNKANKKQQQSTINQFAGMHYNKMQNQDSNNKPNYNHSQSANKLNVINPQAVQVITQSKSDSKQQIQSNKQSTSNSREIKINQQFQQEPQISQFGETMKENNQQQYNIDPLLKMKTFNEQIQKLQKQQTQLFSQLTQMSKKHRNNKDDKIQYLQNFSNQNQQNATDQISYLQKINQGQISTNILGISYERTNNEGSHQQNVLEKIKRELQEAKDQINSYALKNQEIEKSILKQQQF